MEKVVSSPFIPFAEHFVAPKKNSLLQRIVLVGKNTLFELVKFKHLAPTTVAFVAIPMALIFSKTLLLTSMFWVAYCCSKGIKDLKDQEKNANCEQALEYLKKVKVDFDKNKLVDLINNSKTWEDFFENFNFVRDKISVYQNNTKELNKLAFCNVFDDACTKHLLKYSQYTNADVHQLNAIKNDLTYHLNAIRKHLERNIKKLTDNISTENYICPRPENPEDCE